MVKWWNHQSRLSLTSYITRALNQCSKTHVMVSYLTCLFHISRVCSISHVLFLIVPYDGEDQFWAGKIWHSGMRKWWCCFIWHSVWCGVDSVALSDIVGWEADDITSLGYDTCWIDGVVNRLCLAYGVIYAACCKSMWYKLSEVMIDCCICCRQLSFINRSCKHLLFERCWKLNGAIKSKQVFEVSCIWICDLR